MNLKLHKTNLTGSHNCNPSLAYYKTATTYAERMAHANADLADVLPNLRLHSQIEICAVRTGRSGEAVEEVASPADVGPEVCLRLRRNIRGTPRVEKIFFLPRHHLSEQIDQNGRCHESWNHLDGSAEVRAASLLDLFKRRVRLINRRAKRR